MRPLAFLLTVPAFCLLLLLAPAPARAGNRAAPAVNTARGGFNQGFGYGNFNRGFGYGYGANFGYGFGGYYAPPVVLQTYAPPVVLQLPPVQLQQEPVVLQQQQPVQYQQNYAPPVLLQVSQVPTYSGCGSSYGAGFGLSTGYGGGSYVNGATLYGNGFGRGFGYGGFNRGFGHR